jgi:hypothetical protein
MARPQRNNVDYFPFICKEGKSMFYIEQQYGNDGYATWIKILRELAVTDYHFLNLSDNVDLMYLAAKCRIDENRLKNIINDLAKLKQIDAFLWDKCSVIYSEKFIENIQDAYNKRSNNILSYQGLKEHLSSLGVLKLSKRKSKSTVKPHTILNNSIEDDSIEDYNIENDSVKESQFEEFWNLYNKKVGYKQKCFDKFKKLKEEEIKEIFRTLPEYIKSTPDKKFRKNPETYLNNKSWNDEIIKDEVKGQGYSANNPLGFKQAETKYTGTWDI